MTWLELDDGILEHPKFIRAIARAGSEAIHLWLGIRAYCGQHLTDGHVPSDMLPEVRGPKDPKKRAAALAALRDVGLLDPHDDGVMMHDYLDWSSSRDEVLRRRASATERKRRSRGGHGGGGPEDDGTTQGVTRESRRDSTVTPIAVTNPRARVSTPLPSPPNQIQPDQPIQRPVRLAPPAPPETPAAAAADARKSPDLTDSDDMSQCPTDLAERAAKSGMFGDIIQRFPTVSTEQLMHEAERYTLHFTFGRKAGTRGNRWMSRLRGQLVEKAQNGTLKAPGAIEHEQRSGKSERHGGDPEPFDAMAAVRRAQAKVANEDARRSNGNG